MPRKETLDTSSFDEEVAKAFARVPGGTVTNKEERRHWAIVWSQGERESYVEFALSRKLLPIAFMVACLVDVEHPLIVSERGTLRTKSLLGASVLILKAELTGEVVHIPSEVVHTPCVQVPVVHSNEAYADA